MAYTAQTVISEAQILLNDSGGIVYTSSALVPIVNKALRELSTKMARAGHSVIKEVSSAVQVDAGTVRLGDGAGLPTDLLYPIWLKEKPRGASADTYIDMEETMWEEDRRQQNELLVWNWREEEIKFVGATSNRDVLIHYRKGLGTVSATTSPIPVNDAESYLAARTAAIAAAVIGENYPRADILNRDAMIALDDLMGSLTARRQQIPVRRRRTRYRQ